MNSRLIVAIWLLGHLTLGCADFSCAQMPRPTSRQAPSFDEEALRAHGLRVVRGKQLTLVTDLPQREAIDELPQVFDLAIPQWCEYFSVPVHRVQKWRPTAYLIQDSKRFKRAGILPDDLPPFLNGYQRGLEMWVYAQPSDYYLRMLLLHEGTHGFMFSILGGRGAPWYSEGMSEYLGTHRWSAGQLKLGWLPDSKESAPYWGRIRIVKSDRANDRARTLAEVMNFGDPDFRKNESYAWSWSAVTFLEGHPAYRNAFREMKAHVKLTRDAFNRELIRRIDASSQSVSEPIPNGQPARHQPSSIETRSRLRTAWQIFARNLDYGYKVAEEQIEYAPTRELREGNNLLQIRSDRGWQSSGLVVTSGQRYRLAARGQYLLKQGVQPWKCEPGGVTIEYHAGKPLGILVAAVRANTDAKMNSDRQSPAYAGVTVGDLTLPESIGLRRYWRAPTTGVLFFRVNEPAGQLSDNRGELTISVRKVP